MFRCALSLLVLLAAVTAIAEEPRQKEFKKAALIHVEGVIEAGLENFVLRKLRQAEREKYDLVILEIDSPGGGVEETFRMCEAVTHLTGVHTVAFVPHKAISGGAILALSCDEIVMEEFAQIGDCGPIFQGDDFLFHHVPEKIRTYLIGETKALCQRNGYPQALADAMMDPQVKVVRVRLPDGSEQLMTDRELAARPDAAQYERLETLAETGDGRYFQASGARAKELGLAAATVGNRQRLYERYGLHEPAHVLESTTTESIAYILNMWVVTGLLIVIGLIGIAHEMFAPGTFVGALIAGLCFVLFFWARFLGGTSGWLEVMLFLSGLVFLAMEIFVIPGFGITGILGLTLMAAGIMLALQGFTLPTTNAELATTTAALVTTTVSGLTGIILCAVMLRHMHNIPLLNRLMLKPPPPDAPPLLVTPEGKTIPAADPLLSLGDCGTATTMLRPGGKARFGDQIFDVVADGAFIQPGVPIRVIEMQATRIVVEVAT